MCHLWGCKYIGEEQRLVPWTFALGKNSAYISAIAPDTKFCLMCKPLEGRP